MKKTVKHGYRYRAYPDAEAKGYLMQCFGARRKMYNLHVEHLYGYAEGQGLAPGDKVTLKGMGMPTVADFKNAMENDDGEKYLYFVDSYACCEAKRDFAKALGRYNKAAPKKQFTKTAMKRKKAGGEPGFLDQKALPRFKSKKKGSFTYTTYPHGKDFLKDGVLYLPAGRKSEAKEIPVPLRMHRPLPEGGVIKNVTVTMDGRGRFFVSLCVEHEIEALEGREINKALGLDYSQADFFVDSTGKRANYPGYLKKSMDRLGREQRKLSGMVKGSRRREKQRIKVSRLHSKVANQRRDWLHKKSHALAEKYDMIVVEDLDLRFLATNPRYAKNLHDNGFGYFRLMLSYKLDERGKAFVKAPRGLPTTQTCSACGFVNKALAVDVGTRKWACPSCGRDHDRDRNAALNLRDYGLKEKGLRFGGAAGYTGVCSIPRQTVLSEGKMKSAGQWPCTVPLISEALPHKPKFSNLGC